MQKEKLKAVGAFSGQRKKRQPRLSLDSLSKLHFLFNQSINQSRAYIVLFNI